MPIVDEEEINENLPLQRDLLVHTLRAGETPRLSALAHYITQEDGPIPREVRDEIVRALLRAEVWAKQKQQKRLGMWFHEMHERRWAVRFLHSEHRRGVSLKERDPLGSALRLVGRKFAKSPETVKRWRERRQVKTHIES